MLSTIFTSPFTLHLPSFMRHSPLITVLFLLLTAPLGAQNLGNPDNLPFTLSMEDVTQDEIPGLHSFAFAKHGDWWLIISGRINGLHGFFINTGFPEDKANTLIRIINPQTGDMRQAPTEALNVPYRDIFRATNPQYTQDGKWLYITGGYGKDLEQNKFVTFPVLTAIDVPLIIEKLLNNQDPSPAIRQVQAPQLQVCGGEMDKLGDFFYLVGGHNFSGLYNQNGPPQFTQAYTNEIRKFRILNNGSSISISDYSVYHDENHLHRRDFSLAPVIRPNGSEALCLYGGVFRVGVDLPFYNPVYIAADEIFKVDEAYNQLFSQYTCPVVPIFDSLDQSMYSIFFGGLSVHSWENGQLKYDEKVPFIKDITTFQRKANGSSQEYVMPQRFEALLGSNMIFVLNENSPHHKNEVLKLRQMSGPTFVGYLFGGIKAEIPNLTPSSANNRLYKVYITPKNSVDAAEATHNSATFRILPNPCANDAPIQVDGLLKGVAIRLSDQQGRLLFEGVYDAANVQNILRELAAGLYFISAGGQTLKWVKL